MLSLQLRKWWLRVRATFDLLIPALGKWKEWFGSGLEILPPSFLWGDEFESWHRPAYSTYYYYVEGIVNYRAHPPGILCKLPKDLIKASSCWDCSPAPCYCSEVSSPLGVSGGSKTESKSGTWLIFAKRMNAWWYSHIRIDSRGYTKGREARVEMSYKY